jgi:hypothetical protein
MGTYYAQVLPKENVKGELLLPLMISLKPHPSGFIHLNRKKNLSKKICPNMRIFFIFFVRIDKSEHDKLSC